ncbi:hypothetical protein Lal_00028982 [Lupinus albus]|uniref:Putative transcription factor AS2-LOB family n=1 Tax=Lupinus albus TaxID=3870 RepID=A0A6A5NPG6_LUPAL|nr:putative transcription factor AS2-LOB family [Lupinus albus]KAF1885093.1 hypothetical protein Lal_00028982 [Lupinus albus]
MQGNNKVLHSACASCKHQRKKCNEKCILAPYFPSSRSYEFDAVHKVFGVSNITKLVKNVRVEDRRMIVDSLIWEACCRQRDPIQGPYGEYTKICHEYEKVFTELQIIRDQNHLIMQLPSHLGLNSSEKNVLNYLHGNKNNVIIDSNIYKNHYCPVFVQDLELENMKPEVIPSLQQHSQPYYVTGIIDS